MTLLLVAAERLGSPILGVIIPGVIFLIAFGLTYWLYRHFVSTMNQPDETGTEQRPPGSDAGSEGD